jgi:SAM-dependent methyltransferase
MPSYSFEEKYFHQVYQGNYLLRNPAYKWKAFLQQILLHRQQGNLLDVGCAFGLFLIQASHYFDCAGCDISSYALEHARNSLPDTVYLFSGALGELPSFRRYDVITCFDVIEHIQNLNLVWINLLDLLNPGGLLVITVPVYDGPLGWLVNRMDQDPSHVHRRERVFWLEQVQSHFQILGYLGIWRYFFFNRYYLNVVSSVTRSITTAILLIAEKP